MAIHTFRYRHIVDVEIVVHEDMALPGNYLEMAKRALADNSEYFLDGSLGACHIEEISRGITGKVIERDAWRLLP